MKTLNELWSEVVNHPDFVTGRIWRVEDVADSVEGDIDNILGDTDMDYDEKFLQEIGIQFTKDNRHEIANIIDDWEEYAYQYERWDVGEPLKKYLEEKFTKLETNP